MPVWLTAVVVPLVAVSVSLAAQLFFKWVPETKDQKRHLKRVGWWALDIFALSVTAASILSLAHYGGPVTPLFVIGVASSIGALVFNVILCGFRRFVLDGLLKKHIELFQLLVEETGQHSKAIKRHRCAFCLIVSETALAPKTTQSLLCLLSLDAALPRTLEADCQGRTDSGRVCPVDTSPIA
jgi:hypothetical protein